MAVLEPRTQFARKRLSVADDIDGPIPPLVSTDLPSSMMVSVDALVAKSKALLDSLTRQQPSSSLDVLHAHALELINESLLDRLQSFLCRFHRLVFRANSLLQYRRSHS